MGEIWGGGSAKKAAKMQVDAIDAQTKSNVRAANMAAEAAANQMANAGAMRAAQSYADELLNKPAEVAQVSLRPEDTDMAGDLLTRRKGVRSTYQNNKPRSSGLSIL